MGSNATAPNVDILLGTYNGERFLGEQLRSIEAQTFSSWRVIARDDGSSDGTRSMLEEFGHRYGERFQLITDDAGRLGPAGNFGRLLAASTAPFVCFCDQDDVWLPEKVATLVEAAQTRPTNQPLLVHSDLEVVDDALRPVSPSFWAFEGISPSRDSLNQLLVQNCVTGCACLINDRLREIALPVPPAAIMHDWWLALVAAACGEIRPVPAALVRYRQHGSNDTGAKRWGPALWLGHARGLLRPGPYRKKAANYRAQAAALDSVPHGGHRPLRRKLASDFARLAERPYLARVRFVLQNQILMTGFLRNILWLRSV